MAHIEKKLLVVGLLLILIVESFWFLGIGSVPLKWSQIYETINHGIFSATPIVAPGQGAVHDIIWLLRMPRLLLAAAAGAGLAVCGAVMQAIVKNPLADPYILGISSGASLGATLSILLGVGMVFGSNFIGVCAFLGALSVSVLVLLLANIGSNANSVKLLLAGMALNTACSAITSFIVYFANTKDGIQTVVFWLMGSFAGAKWEEILFILPLTLLGILFFLSQYRILDIMLLGDQTAITLGTDLHRYRQVYLLGTSLLVGFIVSATGMIGFVGLIVPHIIRAFVGSNHKYLLPLSALTGGILLVLADSIGRTMVPRTEIPVGIIVSIIGAPGFIYLIARKSYGFGGDER